jgi:hypothetical protein
MLSLLFAALCAAVLAAAAPSAQEQAVQLARRAASQQLGIAPDRFAVRTVEPAEWPDSSLGCPRQGTSYLPVVTRGYRVVLEAEGRISTVHVAGGNAVLCEPGLAGRSLRFAAVRTVQELARHDLAARLHLPEDAVRVKSLEPRKWPDASLGCPKPDTMYAQVETPGFSIELEARGKTYRYHSDYQRVVLCNE